MEQPTRFSKGARKLLCPTPDMVCLIHIKRSTSTWRELNTHTRKDALHPMNPGTWFKWDHCRRYIAIHLASEQSSWDQNPGRNGTELMSITRAPCVVARHRLDNLLGSLYNTTCELHAQRSSYKNNYLPCPGRLQPHQLSELNVSSLKYEFDTSLLFL